jgi:hypothetical protein
MCRPPRRRLPDADTHAVSHGAAVHPWPHVSGRNGHAAADEGAEGNRETDSDAGAHGAPVGDRADIGADERADGGTDLRADADAGADGTIGESWARRARSVRLGLDDRGIGLDLAPVPELTIVRDRRSAVVRPFCAPFVRPKPTP